MLACFHDCRLVNHGSFAGKSAGLLRKSAGLAEIMRLEASGSLDVRKHE